jgi:hypothetical protein
VPETVLGRFDDIDKYISRDWETAANLKRSFWQNRSATERIEAGLQLYLHARELNANWPSAEDRARDLEHHERMSRLFAQIDEYSSKDA